MDFKLTIPAELKNLQTLRQYIDDTGARLKASAEVIHKLIGAVDESATNIIIHGYQGAPGNIDVEMGLEGEGIIVRLTDQAPLFDPTQIPPPVLTRSLEDCCSGGMGMHIIRHSVDSVTYRITPDGRNELTLRKALG